MKDALDEFHSHWLSIVNPSRADVMSVAETELHPDFIERACHFPHFVHVASHGMNILGNRDQRKCNRLVAGDHCIGITGRHVLDDVVCGFEDFVVISHFDCLDPFMWFIFVIQKL